VARKGLNRETPVPRQGKVFIVGPAFLLGRAGRWCLFKGTRRSSLRTILETVYPLSERQFGEAGTPETSIAMSNLTCCGRLSEDSPFGTENDWGFRYEQFRTELRSPARAHCVVGSLKDLRPRLPGSVVLSSRSNFQINRQGRPRAQANS
jgi:hypothetical protein